jgi:tRNA 2-thiouridine synthesizing protein A
MTRIDQELDVRGYNCPIPLLRTKTALSRMAAGARLRVVATDPGSEIDFRVYAEASGHRLLDCSEKHGEYCFVIEKSG